MYILEQYCSLSVQALARPIEKKITGRRRRRRKAILIAIGVRIVLLCIFVLVTIKAITLYYIIN